MAKYLRKVFLLINLRSIDLFLVSAPTMLGEIIHYLFEPLQKPFTNPFTSRLIDETTFRYKFFYINYIYMLKTTPYNYLKTKKKGRIKRKVLRRLVKLNEKVD